MKETFYKIFDISAANSSIAVFCYFTFLASLLPIGYGIGGKPIILIFGMLLAIPTVFFITWFILATIVLGIEKLIIAPVEFVVYKLGIPKIKINVDVIWKYQQRR